MTVAADMELVHFGVKSVSFEFLIKADIDRNGLLQQRYVILFLTKKNYDMGASLQIKIDLTPHTTITVATPNYCSV